jgi:hypothetical protein
MRLSQNPQPSRWTVVQRETVPKGHILVRPEQVLGWALSPATQGAGDHFAEVTNRPSPGAG